MASLASVAWRVPETSCAGQADCRVEFVASSVCEVQRRRNAMRVAVAVGGLPRIRYSSGGSESQRRMHMDMKHRVLCLL